MSRSRLVLVLGLVALLGTIGPLHPQGADLSTLPAFPKEPGVLEPVFSDLLADDTRAEIESLRSQADLLEGRLSEVEQLDKLSRSQLASAEGQLSEAIEEAQKARRAADDLKLFQVTARREAEARIDVAMKEADAARTRLSEAVVAIGELEDEALELSEQLEQLSSRKRELVFADRASLSERVREFIGPVEGIPIARNRLILAFRDRVSEQSIQAVLTREGATPLARIPGSNVFLVSFSVQNLSNRFIAEEYAGILGRMSQDPHVGFATFDLALVPFSRHESVGGLGECQERLDADWDWDQAETLPCAAPLLAMRFPSAWSLLERWGSDKQVRVGVVDTGFVDHPDLSFRRSDLCEAIEDWHGTAVLSVLAATPNRTGIDGALRNAGVTVCSPPVLVLEATRDLIPQRASSLFGAASSLVGFILHERPAVVNFSMGYNWHRVLEDKKLSFIEDSIEVQTSNSTNLLGYLAGTLRSTVVVAAAGNDAEVWASFPAKYGSPLTHLYHSDPSSYSSVLVVGSRGLSGTESVFSNRGANVYAPGNRLLTYRRYPDQRLESGTSFAAPLVSAVAAMVVSLNPQLTPAEVADVVRRSKNDLGVVDAFEALVLTLGDAGLRKLADLNEDGQVDELDLNALRAAVGKEPLVREADLNGDGRVTLDRSARSLVAGVARSDPEVLEAAWTAVVPPN